MVCPTPDWPTKSDVNVSNDDNTKVFALEAAWKSIPGQKKQ